MLGSLPFFWGHNQILTYQKYIDEYGDVVRFRMADRTLHLIRHPDDIKHVLQENAASYTKGRGIEKMRRFLGDGLLTSEGELWRRQRKLAQPAFHHKRLQGLVNTMSEATAAMLGRFRGHAQSGARIDIAKEMMRVTLAIVGQTLFSADVSGDADAVGHALTVALEYTSRRLKTLIDIPPHVPTPENLRFVHAVKTLDRVVYGIIEERRRTGEDTGDLLSMLMLAKDEETGEAMSDRQLRDEVMTIVLAGHETTANALAWTWYLLSKEPVVWRALREEVTRVLPNGAVPTFEDLPKLKYTRMVIEEAMRLYPPAWFFGRRAIQDDVVHGYAFPARSVVAVSPYYTHRHPDFWPNPEGFDPTRFSPEASATRHKYAYIPFGGGPRICIGNSFAIFEAQVIVAMVTQRYRLDLVPGDPIVPEAAVTLRPKGGVPVTVHAL